MFNLVNSLYLKLFIFNRVGQLKHTNDICLVNQFIITLKVNGVRLLVRAIPRLSFILHVKHVARGKGNVMIHKITCEES